MNYIQYCFLGLIQGLTEFLPVSSSGHLAIFKQFFGDSFADLGMTYDILLHLATLVAVFAVYYKDIWHLITGFFSLVRDIFCRRVDFAKNPNQKLVVLLVIASVPAALVGFLLGDAIESAFTRYFFLVGIALVITGIELIASDRLKEGQSDGENLTFGKALVPGIFQALAIVPGLSRSGSTITGALFAGYKREFAVKFSFLMSIPVILGSALFDIIDILQGEAAAPLFGPSVAGMAVAAIVGYVSIKFMLKLITGNKFHYFAYYCLTVGAAILVWQIMA